MSDILNLVDLPDVNGKLRNHTNDFEYRWPLYDSYNSYINSIARLSLDDELALHKLRERGGDDSKAATKRLVEGHIWVVLAEIASRLFYLRKMPQRDDILMKGLATLVELANRFKYCPEKRARFATYAVVRIKGSISHSVHMAINDIQLTISSNTPVPAEDEEYTEFEELIESDGFNDVVARLESRDMLRKIAGVLLSKRFRKISRAVARFMLYYGINCYGGLIPSMTCQEISDIDNVSTAGVYASVKRCKQRLFNDVEFCALIREYMGA